MFDVSKPIQITHRTGDGNVDLQISFPTDDQWMEYQGKVKLVTQDLGRGKSTTEAPNRIAAAAELFDQIVQGQAELDENEKEQVVQRLRKFQVKEAVCEGDQFVVTMNVPGSETKHTLKTPTAKRLKEFERSHARAISDKHGRSEIRINLQASGSLYDECLVSVDGYVGAVPIIHKANVIAEVVDLLGMINKSDDLSGF